MVVAIDVGNSAVKLALVHGERVDSIRRVPTVDAAARSELARDIAALVLAGDEAGAAEGICLVSVVPEWTEAVMHAAVALGASLLIADHASIPIDARLPNPERVGPDRLLNAYAAQRAYGAPVIVVDLGTATTVDVVNAQGAFLGGAIAPGIELSFRALAREAALLPHVSADIPAAAIGTDTPEAIRSGVVLGHVGAVRELVARIARELGPARGRQPRVVVTGGFSAVPVGKLFVEAAGPSLPAIADTLDPDLTLRGLALLHSEIAAVRVRA
jgi:type III pantothenate kinase